MKSKSINAVVLLILISAVIFRSTSSLDVLEACGDVPFLYNYSFVKSNIIEKETGSKFQLFFKDFINFSNIDNKDNLKINDNVDEWYLITCGEAKKEDIKEIIYNGTTSDWHYLKDLVEKKPKSPLKGKWENNEFVQHLTSMMCIESIDYMIFAKECEPHVQAFDQWSKKKKNYDKMSLLIRKGLKKFRKTKSNFIKLRYSFQLIRMAHYIGDVAQALDLYDFLLPKIDHVTVDNEPSLMYHWIEGHRAGALLKLNRNVEASYIYSKIFESCPSCRASALQSFTIRTQAQWDSLILSCHSDTERATVYAIRARGNGNGNLQDLKEIYNLNPQSKDLETLLIKEILDLEKDLLGNGWNPFLSDNEMFDRPRPFSGQYVVKLQDFIRLVRQKADAFRPQLWELFEGYIQLLAGDYYSANISFNKLSQKIDNPVLADQLHEMQLALEIAQFNKINDEIELRAFNIINNEKTYKENSEFVKFLKDKLASLYKNEKMYGKEFLINNSLQQLKYSLNEKVVADLLKFVDKKDKNKFERQLINNIEVGLKNKLLDIKTTILMQDEKFDEALAIKQLIPKTQWDISGHFEPFVENINDCINCPITKDTINLLNRGELLEEIISLDYIVKSQPQKAPIAYYQLGLAIYNTSFFGSAWQARNYSRSGATWNQIRYNSEYSKFEKVVTDLQTALQYFNKCINLTKNSELAARATYMAAKCQLNNFYLSDDYIEPNCFDCMAKVPDKYRQYFKLLKNNYAKTDYYQKVIDECKYFKFYTTN